MAKRLDSAYREGSSRSWIKHKHRRRERLAVTGWRERDGELPEFLVARPGPWRRAGGRPAARRWASMPASAQSCSRHLAAREVPGRARRTRVRWAAQAWRWWLTHTARQTAPSGTRSSARSWWRRRGAVDELLTVAEVAAILKLNQQTVRNWIDQGSLPALRVGRRVRIRREPCTDPP